MDHTESDFSNLNFVVKQILSEKFYFKKYIRRKIEFKSIKSVAEIKEEVE